MAKTGLELRPAERDHYKPAIKIDAVLAKQRRERAWQVAKQAAQLLSGQFGATRLLVFGSLAHGAWFTTWSDIDLAAAGIPAERFLQAASAVNQISDDFTVNLIDLADCQLALYDEIVQKGIDV